jgi:hypothetical protein
MEKKCQQDVLKIEEIIPQSETTAGDVKWMLRMPLIKLLSLTCNAPIPIAARSKAWVCGRLISGTVGPNPAGHVDVCLL